MKKFLKALKIVSTILTWLGVIILVAGIYLVSLTAITHINSSAGSFNQPYVHEWKWAGALVGAGLGTIGIVLTLPRLFSRPRFLWPVLVALGILICILAVILVCIPSIMTGDYKIQQLIWGSFMSSLPGIFCVFEGVIIRWLRRRQNRKTLNPESQIFYLRKKSPDYIPTLVCGLAEPAMLERSFCSGPGVI